jgi:mono/diheme cytochrome c family protein
MTCHGAQARGDGPDADVFSPRPRNLRAGILAQYSDDELVERIRHGKPLGLARDPEALRARAGETELLVAHMRRLPKIDWRVAERGQELYVDRCELCHGPFGHPSTTLPLGVTKAPRDLSDPAYQRATSDDALLDRVRHGHQSMPAIPDFGLRENRTALVAFVRLLSPGYETYTRFCAACHGDDGRGPGVDWASEKRPTVVFDAAYFAKKDPEALQRDVWHMVADEKPQMPHMSRVLRPSEVRSILQYLRSLPPE